MAFPLGEQEGGFSLGLLNLFSSYSSLKLIRMGNDLPFTLLAKIQGYLLNEIAYITDVLLDSLIQSFWSDERVAMY